MATVLTAPYLSARSRPGEKRPGLLSRCVSALMEARRQKAERDIAEILARRGGIMRDEFARGSLRAPSRSYPFRNVPSRGTE